MAFALFFTAWAWACEATSLKEVANANDGSVLVLGERHGMLSDLARAARIARRLSRRGPVTIALEAVAMEHQDVMDRLTSGDIRAAEVEELARWSETWRHDFRAYRRLLSVRGAQFVAAGPPLEKRPEGVEFPIPEEYDDRLRSVALGHGMSEEEVPTFSASMAWRDYRITELALDGWQGRGVLMVVAGRGHVAGGLGITWQLPQMWEGAAQSSAMLAPDEDCTEGDRHLP